MIRRGTPEDLPRLIEISLAAFGSVTWQRHVDRLFGPLNGLDWRARWRLRVERAMHEQTFLVLVEEGRIAGYACGTADQAAGLGHLDILAVDPAFQGRGCGRRLLHAFEKWVRSEGGSHLTLESLTDNEPANALYRREGFVQVASHFNWFKKIS
jgi:ribosomal protein S18 acetylase RimI-like enzyme